MISKKFRDVDENYQNPHTLKMQKIVVDIGYTTNQPFFLSDAVSPSPNTNRIT